MGKLSINGQELGFVLSYESKELQTLPNGEILTTFNRKAVMELHKAAVNKGFDKFVLELNKLPVSVIALLNLELNHLETDIDELVLSAMTPSCVLSILEYQIELQKYRENLAELQKSAAESAEAKIPEPLQKFTNKIIDANKKITSQIKMINFQNMGFTYYQRFAIFDLCSDLEKNIKFQFPNEWQNDYIDYVSKKNIQVTPINQNNTRFFGAI